MSTVHKNSTTIFVEDIVRRIQNGRMILNPFWQRGNVWDEKKQAHLIDSIIKDLHVPELLFCIDHDGNSQSIDGKQRCTALFEFLNDKFQYNGKCFSEMSQQDKNKINMYQLAVSTYDGLDNAQKVEMFRRIQGGVSLTPGEIINSMKEEYEIPRFLFQQIVTNENYIALKNALHIHDGSRHHLRNDWAIWVTTLFVNFIANMPKNTFDPDDSLRTKALKHCSKSAQSLVTFIENYSHHVNPIHWQNFEQKLIILKDIVINVDTNASTPSFFKRNRGVATILPIFHSICTLPDSCRKLINRWKHFFNIIVNATNNSGTSDNDDDDEFAEHHDEEFNDEAGTEGDADHHANHDSDTCEYIKNEWDKLRRKNISPSTIKQMHNLFVKNT